ncbi:MAG: phosphoribosylaminoimidazolesuccinocarboxamide synthase [Nitrospinota bacterium]|jgi:phosphoribosylaminoimidazole-succinocarboxamide synthase|nr:phosphoribosylaminoimidazolesuccinocarboxamide synthase [Nitrospinota bacterium]MDP7168270.1 phosphoribosylaminoimidazolesuccinocarboxamide synthase [Nitrospinota bacterium]MDP7370704.1 phosphoribosylaminoimidazolesuccinocarboxamide synthase [Nitrospinota bacterium]MDP7503838.1 phosphoribosylaminoimidazolesuccinocarboxamide synthase [Nitrospinota bacterium]MDP7662432.1 phosphoribosylaminoimidazolesuccinocarboxamide synthase [Nitrospinota bacterium]
MERRNQVYEGKAKILYETDDPAYLIQYFKDDASAFNAKKLGSIESKGIFNNRISTRLFQEVEANGIPTHFVKNLSEREMLVKRVDIIMVEIVLRNVIAGNLAKRMGVEEGKRLPHPIIDLHLKNDALDDPLINEDTASAFDLGTREEMAQAREYALKVNDILMKFFAARNVDLIDFKLEFGRCAAEGGKMILADEITPDGCRLWEKGTGRKMDKDRFRRDLGNIEATYAEVDRLVTS